MTKQEEIREEIQKTIGSYLFEYTNKERLSRAATLTVLGYLDSQGLKLPNGEPLIKEDYFSNERFERG